MREALIELARAKVNLTLRVLGRRPDGYHELESLVVFADAGDVVEFHPGVSPAVTVRGPFAAAIDGTNIAALALQHSALVAAGLGHGAITIEKRLPVAAGLGGGSADAAAVLRALRHASPERAAAVDWHEVAASLGADVPVCLRSAAQFMWGTGRDTIAVPPLPPLPAVLVNPGVALATSKVFGALAAAPVLPGNGAPAVPGPFQDIAAVVAYMGDHPNDLEPVARTLCRAVGDVLTALQSLPGALIARMSGSGPTCFALFDSGSAAAAAAARIRQPGWWVQAATLG